MTAQENQPSTRTGENSASNGYDDGARNNKNNLQMKPRDPFLFYSNPDNLRRELSLQQMEYITENATSNDTQFIRKTRISFEKDPLTLMMEDDDFRAEFEYLDALMDKRQWEDVVIRRMGEYFVETHVDLWNGIDACIVEVTFRKVLLYYYHRLYSCIDI